MFMVVMEYLVQISKWAVEDRRLELYVNGGKQVEPLIAFVDDVTFFNRALEKSMVAVSDILKEFARLSGLQVSAGKSKVIFSKCISNAHHLAS